MIRDPEHWRGALGRVAAALEAAGTGIMGAVASPIRGAAGNVEFFLHARVGAPPMATEELAALIEPVEVHFQWRPQGRDPSDEMVLEAAVNGLADALVTYNVADFAAAGVRFKIAVLGPAELLRKVKP